MRFLQEVGRKISHAVAVATDWLLIGMGLWLVLIAFLKIDLVSVRYVLVIAGSVLSGFGFWFRWRRLRREGEGGRR